MHPATMRLLDEFGLFERFNTVPRAMPTPSIDSKPTVSRVESRDHSYGLYWAR
jgi:hypothetical protein